MTIRNPIEWATDQIKLAGLVVGSAGRAGVGAPYSRQAGRRCGRRCGGWGVCFLSSTVSAVAAITRRGTQAAGRLLLRAAATRILIRRRTLSASAGSISSASGVACTSASRASTVARHRVIASGLSRRSVMAETRRVGPGGWRGRGACAPPRGASCRAAARGCRRTPDVAAPARRSRPARPDLRQKI